MIHSWDQVGGGGRKVAAAATHHQCSSNYATSSYGSFTELQPAKARLARVQGLAPGVISRSTVISPRSGRSCNPTDRSSWSVSPVGPSPSADVPSGQALI